MTHDSPRPRNSRRMQDNTVTIQYAFRAGSSCFVIMTGKCLVWSERRLVGGPRQSPGIDHASILTKRGWWPGFSDTAIVTATSAPTFGTTPSGSIPPWFIDRRRLPLGGRSSKALQRRRWHTGGTDEVCGHRSEDSDYSTLLAVWCFTSPAGCIRFACTEEPTSQS